MPRVSVIIPVYNVEAYLRQCLDSVVNQTLRDIEIICVDDGSTDGSAAILAEYAAKDARVKVISRVRSNAGAARNAGMAVATGEYLGFVDSDDWCELVLFEKAYAKAKADDADVVSWCYTQYDVRVQKKGAPRIFPKEMLSFPTPFGPQELGESVFAPITYAPWGRLVRRAFVVSEGLCFQEIIRTNDVYFCCMVLALARRQSLLNEILYTYRVGTGVNLQANNAASPDSVFCAWRLVAQELERRKVMDAFRNAFVAASANSLTYTLNVMSTTRGYCDFFERLRKLYVEDPFYSTVQIESIPNLQTATYIRLIRECETPLDFLVKQENYYRERLATEYWSRVRFQSENGRLQKELSLCKDEYIKASRSRDSIALDLSRCQLELQTKITDIEKLKGEVKDCWSVRRHLWNDRNRLKQELKKSYEGQNRLTAELDAIKRTWSYRFGQSLKRLLRKGNRANG